MVTQKQLALENSALRERIAVLENQLAQAINVQGDSPSAAGIIRDKKREASLDESEQLFLAIFHHNPTPQLIVVLKSGRIYAANEAFCRLSGYSRAELIDHTTEEIHLWAHPGQKRTMLAQLRSEGQVQNFEAGFRVGSGEVRTVLVSFTLIEIQGVSCIISSSVDITDRKLAEKTLRESESNLRAFFDTIDHFMFVLDRQANILFANTTVTRRLGYSPDEIIGQSVLKLHPPERWDEARRIIEKMLAGKADFCPVPVLAKDGRQIPVETRVVKGNWSGQEAIFGVVKDLTEIKASEEKFSKAFNASPAPMAITEEGTGCYLNVNERFLQTLGYARDEIIGKTVPELGVFYDPDQRAALLQRMQQQGNLRDEDVIVRTKSGDVRYGVFSAEYLQLQDRRLLLTAMNDVTERKQAEESLRRNQQLLQEALSIANAQSWTANFQADTFEVGPGSDHILGWPPGVYKIADLMALIVPEDQQAARLAWEAANLHGSPLDLEHRMMINGEMKWIRAKARIAFDAAGESSFTLGVSQDITQQKRMAEKLRQSEEKYRTIVDTLSEGILLLDHGGVILAINQAALDLFGANKLEKLEPSCFDSRWMLLDEDGSPLLPDRFPPINALKTGAAQRQVTLGLQKPGQEVVWITVSAQPVWDAQGSQIIYIVSSFTNITPKKQAEDARQAAIQRYYALFEQSHDAVFILGLDGRHLEVNRRAADMLGYEPEEVVKLSVCDTSAEVEQTFNVIDRLLKGERVPLYERKFRKKNGDIIPVEMNVELIRDAQGHPLHIQSLVRDITARKQAETMLLAANDILDKRVQARTSELHAANLALEKALRAKDEFLAAMSHELRTPLTGVIGLAEALQDGHGGSLSERQLKAIRNIEKSGWALLRLVNAVLDFTHLQSDQFVLSLTPCSLGSLCQISLQAIQDKASEKQHHIAFAITPETIILNGDERRIKQILTSLFDNAIKFTPQGGCITVKVAGRPEANQVQISVSDTGIGIKTEDLDRIFQPFVQIDASLSRMYEGIGLGLTLVKALVELHGGSIKVESAIGQGSTFTVLLPWEKP